jgi:hypothetical protein
MDWSFELTLVLIAVAGTLLGALLGGYFAYKGALDAAKLSLAHQAALTRQAAEDERNERRATLAQAAAGQMLDALYLLEAAVPHLRRAGRGTLLVRGNPDSFRYDEKRLDAEAALEAVRRAEVTAAPLAVPTLWSRWTRLRMLATEYARTAMHRDDQPPTDEAPWSKATAERAKLDLAAYCQYVHNTLVAFLDGRLLPADSDPPGLSREDTKPWMAVMSPDDPRFTAVLTQDHDDREAEASPPDEQRR